jgi:DNA-binding NarL/FixJ family response regulator
VLARAITQCKEGAGLDTEGAIALALDAPSSDTRRRELEVASLVADGLVNKRIAARLRLSVRPSRATWVTC